MYVSHLYSITCNHTIPLPYCTIGIVELHENAKIWAESEGEGKGCTFFVLVPVHSHRALDVSARGQTSISARDPIASSLLSNNSSKKLSPRQPLALVIPAVPAWKPTILVVDDSAMNRKVDACLTYPIIPTSLIHKKKHNPD